MLIGLIIVVFQVSCALIEPIDSKTPQKPNYKVTKYTYSRDNETDVMDQKAPNLQLIPLDFLCEFCQVVILKLKERQTKESNFEQTISAECLNSTDGPSSLCDVINRVNLNRLKLESPNVICRNQGMCQLLSDSEIRDSRPPGTSPNQHISQQSDEEALTKRITIDQKDVNTTLHVTDIDPYN